MIFSIDKWNEYRKKSILAGACLSGVKKAHGGKIPMKNEGVLSTIINITTILDECSRYMDSCCMDMKRTPWEYNSRDEKTHISSKKFAFKHLLHLI